MLQPYHLLPTHTTSSNTVTKAPLHLIAALILRRMPFITHQLYHAAFSKLRLVQFYQRYNLASSSAVELTVLRIWASL